ncbi:hypothetical protein MIR68_008667 [Amoeboaphelidium protococcarum]|nr:hypothetical protein MIR68_008667 [Amoeboaphelidium protococcarum]
MTLGNIFEATQNDINSLEQTAHGKAKKKCRACFDFKQMKAAATTATSHQSSKPQTDNSDGNTRDSLGNTPIQDQQKLSNNYAKDCPPDAIEIGRSGWTLLHTVASYYPEEPTDTHKTSVIQLLNSFSHIYPCYTCAEDLQSDLKKNPPQFNTRSELEQYMCNLHNRVNVRLGKPQFDCQLVGQRWRDGYTDKNCD